ENLKNTLAVDKVIYCDHPALTEFTSDAYKRTLVALFGEYSPRAIFFGNTTLGADLSSVLASHLEFPIINSCIKISGSGEVVSQICGGKIMVDSQLASGTTIITMNQGGYKPEEGQGGPPGETISFSAPDLGNLAVKLTQYIEPEAGDVDISQEKILIAIGRGIQTEDNIELADELAELLGGKVCASRPVIDQGWLPTTRLVGKSGKKVKPDLYLSLGISGATEHVEAITGSKTIIAINSDPDAPIFDIAQYGIEADLFDFIDPLIEQLENIKKG
ncbi:MAG: electron transfer flavoprotein subunit alpha/FixB family protein, partial [Anaerolineales bacterium]|nr:electron transfer flavoprotein subunit alpha/FixB family protein [Anaerolineales bacterium]